MGCDWTEKVSLLVDGELAEREAREVGSHVEACEVCRAARADFLMLRRQISSYVAEPDADAQRRALESILSSRPAAPPARRRERFAAAFTLPRLAPAAALLALAVLAVGLLIYTNSRRGEQSVRNSRPAASPAESSTASAPPRNDAATQGETAKEEGEEKRLKDDERPVENPGGRRGTLAAAGGARLSHMRAYARRRNEASAGASQTAAVVKARGAQPEQKNGNAESLSASLSPAALDTGRHVEQAQMLLRSFRNARLSDDDLSYEREKSKKLLYRNIVLRREAASKGDPEVAGLLDRLEPILIDIANLPERPDAEEVNSIRERVRKKNIIVSLQAAAASLPKGF